MMALRMGNWKLVVQNGNCSLYDLATDLHEDTNLASKYPDVLNEMKSILKEQHTNSTMFPITVPK